MFTLRSFEQLWTFKKLSAYNKCNRPAFYLIHLISYVNCLASEMFDYTGLAFVTGESLQILPEWTIHETLYFRIFIPSEKNQSTGSRVPEPICVGT